MSIIILIISFLISLPIHAAQNSDPISATAQNVNFFSGEWYVSWGYHRNYWAPADIHVSQPALNNDFTVHHVQGTDFPQWNEGGLMFDKDLTVPQFNVRVGHFFNQAQDFAVEISLDHSKFSSVLDQNAHITGVINGSPVDTDAQLSSSYFNYQLHNGANHLMINLVKRFSLLGQLNQNLNLTLFAKGGLGLMIPHSENTIFGNSNNVGPKSFGNMIGFNSGWWQINGWTAGIEVALRLIAIRPVYVELGNKLAYANLSRIPVYQGRADQILWMEEWNFSVGVLFNTFATQPSTQANHPI